jgi:hypothetical protein
VLVAEKAAPKGISLSKSLGCCQAGGLARTTLRPQNLTEAAHSVCQISIGATNMLEVKTTGARTLKNTRIPSSQNFQRFRSQLSPDFDVFAVVDTFLGVRLHEIDRLKTDHGPAKDAPTNFNGVSVQVVKIKSKNSS